MKHEIGDIFPTVLYCALKEPPLSSSELEDINSIGVEQRINPEIKGRQNLMSANTYIFNNNEQLANLKEFCEEHIKIYVKKVINPKEKLDFYITQSWLNVTPPGGSTGRHNHPNSILSGIFSIQSVENDIVYFIDPFNTFKNSIEIESAGPTPWNSVSWGFPVTDNKLFLFPSWLDHEIQPNVDATTNRISLAFNVYAKGIFGEAQKKNELIL